MTKVVLAYSGGLDTSILIKLIKEKYNAEVIAVTVDVGQHEELGIIKDKALYTGAHKALLIDAKKEFVQDYILPSLQANALYENAYPLATALARPLMAKVIVAVAQEFGADHIAHGCTGKGNDQVRFESAIAYLAPSMEILAPIREFSLTRDYEIEYAKQHGISITENTNKYSIDENIWGRSIECGSLENIDCEPPDDVFAWTRSPLSAPNYTAYLEIEFDAGVPVALNRKKMDLLALINELNRVGGLHGVGRIDHIESRLVGIKSREVYEAPAAVILLKAHHDLEKLILTKDVLHFKPTIENSFAELVYNGLWFSPFRLALSSFVHETQKNITGTVKVMLYKGSAYVIGRSSTKSLYVKDLATYEGKDQFDSPAAKGFIHIWSLPYKVHSMIHNSEKQTGDKVKEYLCAKKEV
ncbi:MAG: argininosuccinate synthase [bacterium]